MLSSYHIVGYLTHLHWYGYWNSDIGDSSGLVCRIDGVCFNAGSNEEEEVNDPKNARERKQVSHEAR